MAVGTLVPAGPSVASPTCSIADPAFCVSATSAFADAGTPAAGAGAAGEPVDLTMSVTNTSSDVASNAQHWLKSLDLTLGEAGSAPVLTPSKDIPDGTFLVGDAGSGSTCNPDGLTHAYDLAQCAGGVGSGLVTITAVGSGPGPDALNALLGTAPYPVTFGIASLVNQNPLGGPAHTWDYLANLKMTIAGVPILGNYTTPLTQVPVVGDAGAGGLPTLTLTAPSPFDQVFTVPLVGDVTGHFDPALNNLSLKIPGMDTLGTHTLLTNPLACFDTAAQGLASLTDRHLDAVDIPVALGPITGCPSMTGLTSTSPRPYAATLTPAATTATLGRAIDHYSWSFGDGKTGTSPGATTHSFPNGAPRTVSVKAVDNLGALSGSRSISLRGTSMTIGQKRLSVRGVVKDYSSGAALAGRSVRLYRCSGTATPLTSCTLLRSGTTGSAGGYTLALPVLTSVANVAVATSGDNSRIGVVRRIHARPAPVVSLTRSATSVRKGHALTLSGAVTPREAGKSVRIQRFSSRHWHTIATRTLSTRSRYAITLHPGTRGTWTFRVVRPESSTNLVGISPVRRVTVT